MGIVRYGSTKGMEGLPVVSRMVIHGDVVYVCGVTPDPVGDLATQTRQVLERIDRLLHRAGTDRSQILSAQVWLSDMRLFDEHNAEWNSWVDQDEPPVRVCVEARPWQPGMLVEVMVTAAREPQTH